MSKLELSEEVTTIQPAMASALVLQEEPAADVSELIALLQHEADNNRRRFRLWTRFLVGICGFVVTLCLVLLLITSLTGRNFDPSWAFGLFGLIGPGALVAMSTRRHKEVAKQVAACHDPHALGPLIDSLNITGSKVQGAVCEAVIRMLPQLDSLGAAQLTSDQVGMLNYQIRRAATDAQVYGRELKLFEFVDQGIWHKRMRRLLLEILRAAPLFGNGDTLKQIEGLARMYARKKIHAEILTMAETASGQLRDRLEKHAAVEQLIRPATPPGTETLLRSAGGVLGASENHLLRPVDED